MIDLSKLTSTAADEENVFFLRPHWLTTLPLLVGFLLILILPFAAWFGLHAAVPDFFASQATEALFVLGASIFFLFAWLFLFQNFIDFFLDIWMVTTHRIIDIQQHGLFGRTTSELMLERVQDITSEVRGFVHTIFDYGDMYIQTAGQKERFVFDNIPHPTHISKRILELANLRRSELTHEAREVE